MGNNKLIAEFMGIPIAEHNMELPIFILVKDMLLSIKYSEFVPFVIFFIVPIFVDIPVNIYIQFLLQIFVYPYF